MVSRRFVSLLVLVTLVTLVSGALFWQSVRVRTLAWSDPSAWRGGVPQPGADVTIPAGKTIRLDVPSIRVGSLTVDGRLILADRDTRIEARNIVVHGELSAGSQANRFSHDATFVLDGDPSGRGAFVASNGGHIALWGTSRRSWVRLTQTVLPGRRTRSVDDAVDWRAGDRLALAPSGFDASETEEATVAAVSGSTVTLRDPVRFRHWGTVTDGVDERAEVGLLTHNIVVTSDASAAQTGVGGQVIVLRGGRLEANGVEFAGLGQRGKLGRYPIHFHLVGDARDSVVASSSIDHSLNRCLTIHGTGGVNVRDDVAYDTTGHCFFLEDGIETGNVFQGNLALATHGAAAGDANLDSDIAPASYWISNPANTLIGNVAAGSDGNGFWYDLPPHPTGPSATASIAPRTAALGDFEGNVAHSNAADGLFVDILRNPAGVTEAPNYNPPGTADFRTFVAYKNRKRGAWLRGTNLRLSHAVIADNSIGVTFAGANAILRDSRVVGTTANETGPPKPTDPSFPIRGFEFYDGPVGVERTQFANFVPDRVRQASALSALRFSPFFMDPTSYASGLTFDRAQRVFFEAGAARRDRLGGDGYRDSVFRDVDGSVTGTADATVAIDSPLVAASQCRREASWGALVCAEHFGSVFILGVDGGATQLGPVRVALVTHGIEGGDPLVLFGNPQFGTNVAYQTNVRPGYGYRVAFGGRFPAHLRLGLHHFAPGDRVSLYLPQAPADFAPAQRTAFETHVFRTDGTLVIEWTAGNSDTPDTDVIDLCARGICT